METDTLALLRDHSNILWTCLAAFLVFFMQAGFALVESGFHRPLNKRTDVSPFIKGYMQYLAFLAL